MDVELPDGTVLQDVPDGISKADLTAKLKKNGYDVSKLGAAKPEKPAPSAWDRFIGPEGGKEGDGLRNFVGKNAVLGALSSAAGIGATIMQPFQALEDKLSGKGPTVSGLVTGQPQSSNQRTRAGISGAIQEMGADPNSLEFRTAKLGTDIAGTAGVGGALAAPARALAPALSPLANALASSGFTTGKTVAPTVLARAGDMATRMAGGGATSAATMAMIDPEHAGTAAMVGAALPPIVKATSAAVAPVAQAIGNRVIGAMKSPTQQAAEYIAAKMGANNPEAVQALRARLNPSGPSLIPGDVATVPQLAQNMDVSQLARTVHNAGGTQIAEREALNNQARLEALNRISPVSGTLQQSAENFGNAVQDFARPAEAQAGKSVSALYDAVDPAGQTRVMLPVKQMQGAKHQYLGPGTFGSGKSADAAIKTASEFGGPVTFREVQNLRSSIGEAATQAAAKGQNKEAAALTQMKAQIDARLDAVAAGKGKPDEVFPAEIVKAWRDANAAHADKMQRFHTGPQQSMFRQGGDGQPSAMGAELASRFVNAGRSQVEDAKALLRLNGPDGPLIAPAKNYLATDAAGQTTALGTLSNPKFNNWLAARSGTTREILSPSDSALLAQVGKNLERADSANRLGMATGSNTAQNATSALSAGLLDSPITNALANRIPGVRAISGPALKALQESARAAKAKTFGELLANPEALDNALAKIPAKSPIANLLMSARENLGPTAYRGTSRSLSQN